jgi:hypothetical protein
VSSDPPRGHHRRARHLLLHPQLHARVRRRATAVTSSGASTRRRSRRSQRWPKRRRGTARGGAGVLLPHLPTCSNGPALTHASGGGPCVWSAVAATEPHAHAACRGDATGVRKCAQLQHAPCSTTPLPTAPTARIHALSSTATTLSPPMHAVHSRYPFSTATIHLSPWRTCPAAETRPWSTTTLRRRARGTTLTTPGRSKGRHGRGLRERTDPFRLPHQQAGLTKTRLDLRRTVSQVCVARRAF